LKLNSTLVFLLALAFSSKLAVADDALALDSERQDSKSMTWPMLPGESLNDVARLFYPKNKQMQRQFVFKTLRLSTDIQPHLDPAARFVEPTLLVIPTLKSLSGTNAIHKQKKTSAKKLQMSLNLEQAVEKIPSKLIQEYEFLVSKNNFLKEELAKLNAKIAVLQTKLDEMKLILDKTLTLLPETEQGKKAFKNLGSDNAIANKKSDIKTAHKPVAAEPTSNIIDTLMEFLNTDLAKIALALSALLLLGAFLLKKYRQRMFSNLSFVATKLQETAQEVTGYLHQRTETMPLKVESVLDTQASKEVSDRLDATMQEAKTLMSVNRSSDAIAHLKLNIEAQPKASISHWLYLLEIFRKLNLKEDFEKYASDMHHTFNVMTPVWYDTEVAIYVPKSLEEFPHIMEKLYSIWPGELATVYLRNLITDNRGGERTGFGKEVLSEILMLIELIDIRKELA
jgi:hypothetical protein